MINMPTKEKKADYIKRMCQENNLTVAEVLRKAGASPTLLVTWDKEDPKSIQMYDAIVEAIEVLSKEKQSVE